MDAAADVPPFLLLACTPRQIYAILRRGKGGRGTVDVAGSSRCCPVLPGQGPPFRAFFKFAWSFRLHNYCSVLLGAAPLFDTVDAEGEALARRAGRISSLAARHFNRGLRAYFFALAALAWLLHPLVFMACTAYVLYVLQRREFRSKSLRALKGESDAEHGADRP